MMLALWLSLPGQISGSVWQLPDNGRKFTAQHQCDQESRSFGTANWDILQYNDVLLMKAEALIELGQQELARPLIQPGSVKEQKLPKPGPLILPDIPKQGKDFPTTR